jgi:Na+-driven multidrug efflux pump
VLTQITLDPLLIFGLRLGVRGAALGTVGGQAVSLSMSLWFFFGQRNRPYRIRLADVRPHSATLRELVSVGAPSFLSGSGVTLLTALANNLLIAIGGPLTLTLRATVLYGSVVCLALLALAGPLVGLFTDEPPVRAEAATALRVLAFGYPLAGVAPLVSARFQAVGQPRPSYLISIGTVLAVKVPLLVALSRYGTLGLWISFPTAELATAALAVLILRRKRCVTNRVTTSTSRPMTSTRRRRDSWRWERSR